MLTLAALLLVAARLARAPPRRLSFMELPATVEQLLDELDLDPKDKWYFGHLSDEPDEAGRNAVQLRRMGLQEPDESSTTCSRCACVFSRSEGTQREPKEKLIAKNCNFESPSDTTGDSTVSTGLSRGTIDTTPSMLPMTMLTKQSSGVGDDRGPCPTLVTQARTLLASFSGMTTGWTG